jgi:hypothetical protein
MAEVQKRTETVVKDFYRLDLTQEEGKFLADLLGCVGGSSEGRRRHAEEIAAVLKSVGLDHGSWSNGHYRRAQDMDGSVAMS